MSKKNKYREFCLENDLPIFHQDWWLDFATNNSWDVCISEKNEKVIAVMPYSIEKKFAFKVSSHPKFTPRLGPWKAEISENLYKELSKEKEVYADLMMQLPKFSYFSQNWHYSNKNWLPFHWNGFKQKSRVSYILNDIDDSERVWKKLQSSIKTDIRKAKNKNGIIVRSGHDINDFLDLYPKTFERQSKKPTYSRVQILSLYNLIKKKNAGEIFVAYDSKNRAHACALIVWDKNCAYYLLGSGDPLHRNSGATSYCLWEAIQHSSNYAKDFDFEGSMIEGVERYFRKFGGEQINYNNLQKIDSTILRLYMMFKGMV